MKRTKSFSLYAFIIALLVHLITILLLILLDQLKPTPPPPEKPSEPQEERFRLSIKELPNTKHEAIVKNDIPKALPLNPIPYGKQMLKEAPSIPKPKASKPIPPETKPISPIPEPIPTPRKAYERHVAKTVAEIEREPQPKGLYDILSKVDPNARETLKSNNKISTDISKTYGNKFQQLSKEEQDFILQNILSMTEILEKVLLRYSNSRVPDNFRGTGNLLLEFYLHPDGSISGLKILNHADHAIMDSLFTETVEIAYSKFPRPKEKTLIRIIGIYDIR